MELNNMRCSPIYDITKEIKAEGKKLLFDPVVLANKLNCLIDEVHIKAFEYATKKDLENSLKKVNKYIIGSISNNNNEDEICEDIDLLIIVFASTYGCLYIPNKKLSFDEERFSKKIWFLKEEFIYV